MTFFGKADGCQRSIVTTTTAAATAVVKRFAMIRKVFYFSLDVGLVASATQLHLLFGLRHCHSHHQQHY